MDLMDFGCICNKIMNEHERTAEESRILAQRMRRNTRNTQKVPVQQTYFMLKMPQLIKWMVKKR